MNQLWAVKLTSTGKLVEVFVTKDDALKIFEADIAAGRVSLHRFVEDKSAT